MKPRIQSLVVLVVAAVLAGCAVGPNYKRPVVHSPDNFRFAENQTTNSLGDLPWWQVFQDPVLQGLIGTAITNNYDLKQAVARVEQARNQAAAANSAFFRKSVMAAMSAVDATRSTTHLRLHPTAPRSVPHN